MTRNAYAKINRSLFITGKRTDGYHLLHSVMQSISLCDEISYLPAGKFRFVCDDSSLDTDSNLCVKAANSFFAAVGRVPEGILTLKKRIPYGAGLGGGSSDAAATLRILNDSFVSPLSENQIYRLAESLGADVPFCIHGGKMLCTGIGEQMTPLPPQGAEPVTIVKGNVSLSTKMMYQKIDERPFDKVREGIAYNAFESVAVELVPEIQRYREQLITLGAKEAMMSGSGSALYGVFKDMKSAETCATWFREQGLFAEACSTMPRY